MKTKREHFINFFPKKDNQRGNAMIYILIAVALFGALSFVLAKQTDTSEGATLDDGKAQLYATQLTAYATQVKSALDQLYMTGTDAADLDFTLPNQAGFNVSPHVNKIYHPQGGGINPGRLSPESISEVTTDPPAGWYMGQFNNVEWTETTAHDVILVAHQIPQAVCEAINKIVTDSTTIPAVIGGKDPRDLLISDSYHGGTNEDFDATDCASCEDQQSLCISNNAETEFSFYNVLWIR